MPFRSEAQRRFMWARHPEIAERWTKEYGSTPEKSDKDNRNEHFRKGDEDGHKR